MNRKINNSIYHCEKYVQMQKLNCILNILFSNDKLTPGKKINV